MLPYLGLERSAVKVACCVLMGVKAGNNLDLPGLRHEVVERSCSTFLDTTTQTAE